MAVVTWRAVRTALACLALVAPSSLPLHAQDATRFRITGTTAGSANTTPAAHAVPVAYLTPVVHLTPAAYLTPAGQLTPAAHLTRSASASASAAAPSAPESFDRLFLPAVAAATAGGAIGYEIGMRWRFLGSSTEQAKRREALLLGLTGGTVASGLATWAVAEKVDDIGAGKALMAAFTGVVPAAALSAAATLPLPGWLQKPVGAIVYGVVQGGVAAWMAGK